MYYTNRQKKFGGRTGRMYTKSWGKKIGGSQVVCATEIVTTNKPEVSVRAYSSC